MIKTIYRRWPKPFYESKNLICEEKEKL